VNSAIYPGVVHHARLKPQSHRLRYRVFNLLLDLDELPAMNTRLFGYNRAALIAFHDKDHGDRSGAPLRPWVESKLAAAGIAFDGGAIGLLCMPRVLNHVFNPLSLYFCYARDGALTAIVYEVNNTFGESHAYVLRADAPDAVGRIVQSCDKRFYVSPFQPMDLTYDFNILPPGDATSTAMVVKNVDGPVLTASFTGKRAPLTDANLLRQWLAHPLLSLKVLAGIHWEALFIWLKGGKFHSNPRLQKPAAPSAGLTRLT
jgi:uncharacterized protein